MVTASQKKQRGLFIVRHSCNLSHNKNGTGTGGGGESSDLRCMILDCRFTLCDTLVFMQRCINTRLYCVPIAKFTLKFCNTGSRIKILINFYRDDKLGREGNYDFKSLPPWNWRWMSRNRLLVTWV